MTKKENSIKPVKKNGQAVAAQNAKNGKAKVEASKTKPAAKPAVAVKKAAAAKAAPVKATPAKAAAKTPVKKAPTAPQAAPKKAAPVKAAPAKKAPVKAAPVKATPVKATPAKAAPAKAAPAKAAPVKAAPPKAAPGKAAPVKAAPVKAAPVKAVAKKPAAPVKAAKPAVTPKTAGESAARKLAIQKIQAKRNQEKPAPKQEIDLSQPTGMYNGIIVTHEIKPFPTKTPYSKIEIDKLREALLDERARLLGQLASLQGVSMEAMVSAKEHSGYSIHIAEHASDLQTAEANMGVRTIEEERLEQVESALDRIENDQRHYGLCMACGNKIGIQRLIAVPHAHLCMPCRKRYEVIRSRRGY